MYKLKIFKRGMMLVSVIMLMTLLVMLTTSMIFIATRTLNIMGKSDSKVLALQSAEAGLEYARLQLSSDVDWGKIMTSDIDVPLNSSDQESVIIFNPSEHHTINNLDGNSYSGTAPPYTAEIICKGIYKEKGKIKQKVYLRGLFSRDDEYPCPVYSSGYIAIQGGNPVPSLKFTGNESNPSPVRIHSNKKISISNANVNLYEGFLSSCSTVDLFNVNSIMTKTDTLPVRVPFIDIKGIIDARKAACHALPSDKFYLVGYFEYDPANPYDAADPNGRRYRTDPADPNVRTDPNDPNCPPYNVYDDPDDPNDDPNTCYCIPHSDYTTTASDPYVHTSSYKAGIARFSEADCTAFLNNYGDFYYNPSASGSGGENRNFFDYYPDIRFWSYNNDPNSLFQHIEDELGMSVSAVTGSITLTLDKDIYIPSSFGLFETGCIGLAQDIPGGASLTPSVYYPQGINNTRVKLELANHKIYGNKLWLGIAPDGTGGILSTETIDFIHSFEELKMIALSEKSVRMAYRKPSSDTLIYRGIIYGKDDIVIQSNSNAGSINYFKYYGTMLCRDIVPDNCESSPMSCYPLLNDNTRNISIETSSMNDVLIVHTTDGRDPLINLRGKDYTIKRMLTEELNLMN